MLKGRHILVGVTGGIAAYKTASLIRLLVKEGAEVKVFMTPLAKDYNSAYSCHPVTQSCSGRFF